MRRNFLIFGFSLLLFFSSVAYAFAPAVVGAITYAGAVVSAIRTGVRLIQNYGMKVGAFKIDSQGRVVSSALAIPQNSQNGVKLDLTTTVPALRDTISKAPTQYPNIINNLIDNGSSGGGAAVYDPDFPDTLAPLNDLAPGDIYHNTKTGTTCRVTSISCNSPNVCWRPLGEFSQSASGCNITYNNNCGSRDCGDTGSAGRLYIQGGPFSFADVDLTQFSDDDFRRAMAANNSTIAETINAQGETYRGLHGLEQTAYPSTTSPAHYSYAGTDSVPVASEIIETVDAIDAAQSGSIGKPVEQPDTEAKIITTVTQGAATISTAADGTRTVSIPITTTVVDVTTGKELSKTTTIETLTYAPGVVIPDDIQRKIDGEESSTESEKRETQPTPPDLTVPDIARINLDPLLQAASVLSNKFPISMVSEITEFFDDLVADPVRPDFDVDIGPFVMHVSFELVDSLASIFRTVLGSVFILLCAYVSIKFWV